MAIRFKDPESPVAIAPQHVSELPEIPLPEHPFPDKGPLSDAAVSEDAPHPIGVDPSVTGAFSTITAEDGTAPIPTTAVNAHLAAARTQSRRRGLPRIAIVLISAIAACFVVGALLILWNVAQTGMAQQAGPGQRVEETQSSPNQPLYYDSYAYTVLQQDDGRWAFVRSAPTGVDPLVLFALEGTPVELVLSDGVFVIPENLDGDWDIMAWVIGDGNVPTPLMGEDGSPVSGEGQLVSASLSDDELTLMAQDGAVTRVPLGFWD